MHLVMRPDPEQDVLEHIEEFKRERGIEYILAFSGGADDNSQLISEITAELKSNLPTDTHTSVDTIMNRAKNALVDRIVRDTLMPLRGYKIAILTGGTVWGVPKIAAAVARELDFPTIGIYPLVAENKGYDLKDDMLDVRICVHPSTGDSRWGDESPTFVRLFNGVVIIGGGAGTMVEVAHALKRNELKDRPVKTMIPIIGSGGTADRVMSFPGKPQTMAKCLPPKSITTGAEASMYLRQNVFYEDVYK